MKILTLTDKKLSAIDRLARMNKRRWEHLDNVICDVHPKRPDAEQLNCFLQHVADADLIDAQYWKTAVMLRNKYPKKFEGKPIVLTHHNEHNINDTDKNHWAWKDMDWDVHVCKNEWQQQQLAKQGIKATLIRHAVEFDELAFTDELNPEPVVGYVGQIKKVKGVREIQQACKELGYRFLVVGRVSEGGYWDEMDKDNMMLALNCTDGERREAMQKMAVYCANSDDGTESGTMPILEAMVSGIPVVTRKIGLVRDCGEHSKNMFIREGEYADIEDLKAALKFVVENRDVAEEMRENAWRTVRQYHPEVQAREYDRLFRRVLYPQEPIVSVIMPTYNRWQELTQNLESLREQEYRNFEVVVCEDGSVEGEAVVDEMRKLCDYPIRYVNTGMTDEYGLAAARNMGLVEAVGDIVVFCDDRLQMHRTAVSGFVSKLTESKNKRRWVWGSKGVYKSFVENFSATWRQEMIYGGGFNERIKQYGGMTQDISKRYNALGWEFTWCAEALAEPISGTKSKWRKREEIIKSKILLYKLGLQ